MFGMKIVSVNSKHYHPSQPWHKSSKSGKSWPSLQIFLSNVQPPDFPGNLNFDKFYTFPPLSRSQSLEYLQICMVNIYLLIENMWKWKGGNAWNWLWNKNSWLKRDQVWQTFKSLWTTVNAWQFNFCCYAYYYWEIISKQYNMSILLKCNS